MANAGHMVPEMRAPTGAGNHIEQITSIARSCESRLLLNVPNRPQSWKLEKPSIQSWNFGNKLLLNGIKHC